MKLYYSPYTCSQVAHILLRETGVPFALERVDLATHKTETGEDYYQINPKGPVPLLVLANGEYLSEGPIIAQYISETTESESLLPRSGMPRYRVLEWQNYVSTELHKSFSPLFNSAFDEEAKNIFRAALRKKYEWIETRLGQHTFLTGETFTVADAYLFVVTGWAKMKAIDLKDLPKLQSYLAGIAERPAVREALRVESAATK